jgi:hypothetical protein
MTQPDLDWNAYRACPVCKASIGEPCVSRSGMVVGGRPDGVRTVLHQSHLARKARTGR